MSHIFISYAHEDRSSALKLYRDLRKAGWEPWIDVEDLLGGQDWRVAVGEAIRSSSYFLALISKSSISKRGYVQRELRDAIEAYQQVPPGQIYVIPIRLDDTNHSHPLLTNLHWIDLFPSYSRGLQRLLKSLGNSNRKTAKSISPDEKHSVSVAISDVLSVIQPPAERDHPKKFSAGRTVTSEVKPTRESSEVAAAVETDHWDDCILDEDGNCSNTNQKHWGSNE